MKKNIVLVGMMGSGKSTIAQLLKSKLEDFDLIDIDSRIVDIEGKSVNEIFENDGESYFRNLEQSIIKDLALVGNHIISTGGGVCKNKENIENLRQNGVLFYLSTSCEELCDRLKNDNSRPLLKEGDLKSIIENLLKEREVNYKLADFEIETNNKSLESIVEEIIEKYGKYE